LTITVQNISEPDAAGGRNATVLFAPPAAGDTRRRTATNATYHAIKTVPLLPGEATLDIRVLVDRPAIEAFIQGGRTSFVNADTPFSETNSSVHLFSSGAHPVVVHRVEAYQMGCGWSETLPVPLKNDDGWPAVSRNHGTPPPNISFVAEFEFRARVVALDPPAENSDTVVTQIRWGRTDGQTVGTTHGFGWTPRQRFTRAGLGTYWGGQYPNSFGLTPRYTLGRFEDSMLVTHLFFCHVGSEPSQNASQRSTNQTTSVQLEISLGDQPPFLLEADLLWSVGYIDPTGAGNCDDFGVIVGRTQSGQPFVETYRQHNAKRYWTHYQRLPEAPSLWRPQKLVLLDTLEVGDGDIGGWRDALRALDLAGMHGIGGVPRAWLMQEELGYVLSQATSNTFQQVASLDYADGAPCLVTPCPYAGNLTAWAQTVAEGPLAQGYAPTTVLGGSSIHDEPGMAWPATMPPVASNENVRARWQRYLQEQGLTPPALGFSAWSEVMPSASGWQPGSSLTARRLYYWSIRFVARDSIEYSANATRAVESALAPGMPIFQNFNK